MENSVIRNIFPSRLDSFCFSNCQLVPVGSRSDLLIFRGLERSFWGHFGVQRDHFGVTLALLWCKGAPRRTLGCPKVDFWRFGVDFGSPIGDTFGSLFDIFCDLRSQKVRLDCSDDFK